MKILIAPGAFKHSLTHTEAADRIAAGLMRSGLAAELHRLPLADGGNGTLDAFLVGGGRRVSVATVDANGRAIEADYGLLDDGRSAVIEMALASGLELIAAHELAPLTASTYGTGLLLRHALESGARRFIIGLGGSATTDGGAGCLQALGVRLLARDGSPLPPGGAALADLETIDVGGLDPRWRECEVIIASDVENPALGEQGAAAVFAPQKGATPADVAHLEAGLSRFFARVAEQVGQDVRQTPGGGAAGAFAAGLMAFLGGRIESGVDLILDYHRFDEHLRDAHLVVTGEGRLDMQTLSGKGPLGIARRAAAAGVPTVAIAGSVAADDALLHEAGIWAALPIVSGPMTLGDAIAQASTLVERAALRLGYLLRF